jgi:hypothetical protein
MPWTRVCWPSWWSLSVCSSFTSTPEHDAQIATGDDPRATARTTSSQATTSSSPGPGRDSASRSVPRPTLLVGVARAKELIFTGRTVGAGGAAAIGLLHETVVAEEAEPAALRWPRTSPRTRTRASRC